MMSQIPINLEKIKKEDIDREILRTAIIAELDAVNLYEQMVNLTSNAGLKSVLADIGKEEKTHIGEFQAMLLNLDAQQKSELIKGEKEVDELLK